MPDNWGWDAVIPPPYARRIFEELPEQKEWYSRWLTSSLCEPGTFPSVNSPEHYHIHRITWEENPKHPPEFMLPDNLTTTDGSEK